MKRAKSAKDMAFDKERAKYRKRIRELEREVSEFRLVIAQKDNESHVLRNELEIKQDWVRRLLEYTELSEDDMRAIIDKEKSVAVAMKMFGELGSMVSSIYKIR